MIGRRSTIGLALLCAFAFCAFAAQSAMAEKGVHAVNTTAVTCVPSAEGFFKDAHCDEKLASPTGKFEHAAISNDTTTEIEVSQTKTSKLKGTLAGVNTEVTCNKVKSVAGKSFIHNVEIEKKHTVTGTVQVQFTECTVLKPTKCVIKEPIVTTATFEGVEELGINKDTMGVEFVGKNANKEFAELTFENKGAEKCALLNGGKPFIVLGSVIATGTPPPKEKHAGATLNFNMFPQTLEIGLKPAEFEGTFTTTMAGAGGNPIALTTTT
jgi:hypothetical protein